MDEKENPTPEELWEKQTELEEKHIFRNITEKFHFPTEINKPEKWPGLKEPFFSITYDVSDVYQADNRAELEIDLQYKLLKIFEDITIPGEYIYVYDWQNPSYKFSPRGITVHNWKTPAFPDGDYHIFLTEDLENGFFGHPREKIICVFGRKFIKALEKYKPKMFTKITRKE